MPRGISAILIDMVEKTRARAVRSGAAVVVGLMLAATIHTIGGDPRSAGALPVLEHVGPEVCEAPPDALAGALCDDAPEVFDPELTDWERTSALRDWAYANIDASATKAAYDPRDFTSRSAPDIFAGFAADEGGVYCGNAAVSLMQLFRYMGFDAWALDTGLPDGGLTHVVTLVRLPDLGGRVVLQDAYLGGSFGPVDFREVVERMAGGETVEWRESSSLEPRDVLFSSGEPRRGWQFAEAPSACHRTAEGGWSCPTILTLDDIFRHFTIPETMRQLEAAGHDVGLAGIYLYPISVHGGPDLLAELKRAAA